MGWELALLILVGGFLGLSLIGIPVFYAFLVIDIVGMYLFMGGTAGVELLIDSFYGSLTIFILLPVTLFILMGEIMLRTGIANQAIDSLDYWFGNIRGRLAYLAVISGALFASMSGSSIGTAAMLGRSLAPEMERRGYNPAMSIGPILGSGGLAIMIPPSGLGVILAVVAKVSVGKLLLAIILPGLIMAFFYAAYIFIYCRLYPNRIPLYDVPPVPISARIKATVKYVLPFSLLIFAVIGTIFLGVATPTEAAALGVSATLLLAAFYGQLKEGALLEAVKHTLQISVMILLILAAASVYSQLLAFSGVTRALVDLISLAGNSPITAIGIMVVITLILGGFITGLPLMLITIPVFMPVVERIGYDPLWFAVIFLLLVEMAQTTPPHGTLLHVMKGVSAPGTRTSSIIKAGLPFLACDFLVVVLMILVPAIVLFIPNLSA